MKRFIALLLFATSLAAAIPAFAQSASPMPGMMSAASTSSSKDSLYKRLGGYDALSAVTDDFITRLATDPQLGRFFVGFSTDSKQRIRQHIIDFLCQATGGPCVYKGRDMKTAHAGMGVTEAEWKTSVMHLGETLNKFKVPTQEQQEVVNALAGLHDQIVEKP